MKSLLDTLKRQYNVVIKTSELVVGDIWHFDGDCSRKYIVVDIDEYKIHMSNINGGSYAFIEAGSEKLRFLISNRAPTQKEIENCLNR